MVKKNELRRMLEARDIELISGKTVPATGFSNQLKKSQLQELFKASIPKKRLQQIRPVGRGMNYIWQELD